MSQAEDKFEAPADLYAPSPAPRWAAGIFLVLIAVVVVMWLMGKLDPLIDRTFPELAEMTGTVTLNGKPMERGLVQSYQGVRGRMGGLSPIAKDGTFKMTTNGDPGVFCGEHKIVVNFMTETFPPKSLLPETYTNPKLSPFCLVVKRGKANHIDLAVDAPDLIEKDNPTGGEKPQPTSTKEEAAEK